MVDELWTDMEVKSLSAAATHGANVMHCDVKPSNVLLTSSRAGVERVAPMCIWPN